MKNNNLEVVQNNGQENTLTSLQVAEMVGRNHADVMRDIRNIVEQLNESKIALVKYFKEASYKGGNGQERPMFLLTKKGCELYSTRMTGSKGTAFAVRYIEVFNEMENELKAPALPTTYKEALQHLLIAVEEKEVLEEKVALAAPKVEAYDIVTANTKSTFTTTQIASNYGMSAIQFNRLLHKLGVQYKQSGVWKLYVKYEGKGYTVTPLVTVESGDAFRTMKWTPKGEFFLYELLKENGYTPTSKELFNYYEAN